jgi:integrase
MPFQDRSDDLPFPVGENVSPQISSIVPIVGKPLNELRPYGRPAQVCARERKAKNLDPIKGKEKQVVANAEDATQFREKIVEFAWWLKKQGYAETTIISRVKILKILAKRGANLYNPESIKGAIANQKWSQGRKENAVHAYSSFLKMVEGKWEPPRYKRVRKIPWIPTETEVDQLIAGCSNRVATFLQLLKETGMRPGEAWQLKWIDFDFINKTVHITPEKGSNPRILRISNKLIFMLNALPQKNEYAFGSGLLRHFADGFRLQRKRMVSKLKNPRIKRISFRTLRHFKATMEYKKTKDILHVKRLLGHKRIENTLVYTHLIDFGDDEYISKISRTAEDARQLVEAGFEYVCTTPENLMLFKKRK